MLRRLFAVIALAAGMSAAALTLATPAVAKGPSRALITGPGLASAIIISGQGEPGMPGVLSTLAAQTGLFKVMFGANAIVSGQPAPRSIAPPPTASLGPRYVITYTVPGLTPQPGKQWGQIRQDLYPRAAGGPVIYTPPGQRGFGRPLTGTRWLRGSPNLLRTLARAGVPSHPRPVAAAHHAARPAARPAGSGAVPWLIASATAIAAMLTAAGALGLRRRRSLARRAARP